MTTIEPTPDDREKAEKLLKPHQSRVRQLTDYGYKERPVVGYWEAVDLLATALAAPVGKPVVSREESSPTLAAAKEAETFGITLSSTAAAYIAEAVLAASGLRESRESVQAEALREAAKEAARVTLLIPRAGIPLQESIARWLRARADGLEPAHD